MSKARGGDGIPAELFQILKHDPVKVLHSTCQQIWKTQQWPRDWKRSVFITISKKGNAKGCSNGHIITLISHASKVMLKILQTRFQQNVNHELSNIEAFTSRCRKQKNKRSNIQHLLGHRKNKIIPEKHLLLLHWLYNSIWLCRSQQSMENSSRDGTTRLPYLPPEKPVCRSRSNS